MIKPDIFKHTDDKDNIYYEVVWFTDYNTKSQKLHSKLFDTINQAEQFVN